MPANFYVIGIMALILLLALWGGTGENRKRHAVKRSLRSYHKEKYDHVRRGVRRWWLWEVGIWLAGLAAIGLLALALSGTTVVGPW